jgi:hypothetical protein
LLWNGLDYEAGIRDGRFQVVTEHDAAGRAPDLPCNVHPILCDERLRFLSSFR